MWERYFKYRSSSEFIQKWTYHLSTVGHLEESPSPIFYQFVTDVIMEHLIKEHFPVTEHAAESSATLDYEEHNAIRYTAGYVLRALQNKIDRSSHPLKVELALSLEELKEEGNDLTHSSEEWLQAIDRGGLVHVRVEATCKSVLWLSWLPHALLSSPNLGKAKVRPPSPCRPSYSTVPFKNCASVRPIFALASGLKQLAEASCGSPGCLTRW